MRINWVSTLVFLTALPLAAADVAPTGWEAVAAAGSVESRAGATEAWAAVSRGDTLAGEAVVRTGRKGRTTLLRGANVILVDPGSEVILPAAGSDDSRVMQTRGSVMYEVERRDRPHFEVVTPYLVAGVKGTSFLVTVHDEYTSVRVETGRVEVFDPATGDRMDVTPGDAVIRMHDSMQMEHTREHLQAGNSVDKDVRRALRDESRRLDRMDRALARDSRRTDRPLVADSDRRDRNDRDRRRNGDLVVADAREMHGEANQGNEDADDDDDDLDDVSNGNGNGNGDDDDLDDIDDLGDDLDDTDLNWATGLDDADHDDDEAGDLDDDHGEAWEEDLVDDDIRNGLRPGDEFTDPDLDPVDPTDPTGNPVNG